MRPESDKINETITVTSLNQDVVINGKTYSLVLKDQYAQAVAEQKEIKEDVHTLKNGIIKTLATIGLIDEATGQLKDQFKTKDDEGNESIEVKPLQIVKILKDMVFMFMSLSRDEITEKFSFLKPCLPIIKKYAGK